jgi:hypothetical protein
VTSLRLYVTGINDAILNEVGRTTAVYLEGRIMDQEVRRDTALGHLLVVPLGNAGFGVWISMTSLGGRLSSHKGQWSFTTGASHAAAL